MVKKIICLALALMLCCFCACAVEVEQEQQISELPADVFFYIWTDEETGVQYIVYEGYRKGGITPRLNADGTLWAEDGGEEE